MSLWCNILTQISGVAQMMTRLSSATAKPHMITFYHIYLLLFFLQECFFFFFLNFRNGRMTGRMRMTGGLCYSETFKAEISLVILCLTCQKAPLTFKLVLLNSCMVPQMMSTSINKWCFWHRGRYLLTFIHTKPIMSVKNKPPLKIKKNLASLSSSCEWLFCSGAVGLLLPACK